MPQPAYNESTACNRAVIVLVWHLTVWTHFYISKPKNNSSKYFSPDSSSRGNLSASCRYLVIIWLYELESFFAKWREKTVRAIHPARKEETKRPEKYVHWNSSIVNLNIFGRTRTHTAFKIIIIKHKVMAVGGKACAKSTIRISNLKFEIWRKSKEIQFCIFLDAVAAAGDAADAVIAI